MNHRLRVCITYLFLFITSLSFCQNGFRREYYHFGSLTSESKSVFETTSGNYIMGGITVDTLNGSQFNRLTFIGIDHGGQRTWTKKYGSKNFEYLDGLICKWFYKQNNFLYHAGSARDSNNKYLGVLVKLDFSGDTMWQRKFYDPNYEVIPQMVVGSMDGGFLITGFCEDMVNPNRFVLIIKTDANGNELWRKLISKANPNKHDGKVIIQDTLTKKIIIAGYQYIGSSVKDNLLICDSVGNELGQYSYSSSLDAWPLDLIQTRDKKVVMVGRTIWPQTVGGQNLMRSYAVKVDPESPGTPIWKIDNFDVPALANTFTGIKELKDGSLLLGGVLDTMVQHNLPRQSYQRITKMTSSGVVTWNRYYNYSKDPSQFNTQGIMSINLGTNEDWLTTIEVQNNNPNPYFFVRYDSTGCDSSLSYCSTVGIKENYKSIDGFRIFPNPSKSNITLETNITTLMSIVISDVTGRKIKKFESVAAGNLLDVEALSKGLYFAEIYVASQRICVKQFLKE